MNNLSWLIYAADVADGIGTAHAIVLLGCILVSVAGVVVWFTNDPGESVYSWQDKDLTIASRHRARSIVERAAKHVGLTFFAALIVAVIVPSQTTIYAIAASEMGEEVLKSPAATKAMKALDAWLDRQINDGKSND